ncbi:MAG: hypothetical protein HYX75_14675 [Acidobacteria bacterium]|nr:hypothetical protein [Acidobacteriota bacterium]
MAGLDAGGQQRFRGLIERAIGSRPPAVQRQFGMFLRILDVLPVLRFGRTFTALRGEKQDCILAWLQGSPISLLRSAFWGLKTMTFLGYYGQPEVWPRVSYSPSKRGNEMLHV